MLRIKSCVIQEEQKGCSIACIATILQKSYWEVSRDFKSDFNKVGLSPEKTADYLSGYGFDIIYKTVAYYGDYEILKRRMLEPFADIHIVSIQQYPDATKEGHAMIVTKDGKIFCPSDGKEFNKRFLTITCITGYFYPPNWKFKVEKKKPKSKKL